MISCSLGYIFLRCLNMGSTWSAPTAYLQKHGCHLIGMPASLEIFCSWMVKFLFSGNKMWILKKNILNVLFRDKRVCSQDTSGTVLTSKNSSPHCEAKLGVSRFNGEANRYEHLNCHRACTRPLHPLHQIVSFLVNSALDLGRWEN